MKFGAYTFAFLLTAGVTSAVAFVGCGGDDDNTPEATVDSGVDTGTPPVDSGKDTSPVDTGPTLPACMQTLPTGFACAEPAAKAGSTACTDEAIDAIVTGCFSDASTSTTCSSARAKYKACDTCTLTNWLVDFIWPDSASCIKKVAPTDTCAKSIQCNFDCMLAVCPTDECDTSAGSGTKATTSQFGDCITAAQSKGTATKPKGFCYDVATKDYSACATKEALSVCFPRTDLEYVRFFRGACRDNGDWTNVDVAKPTGDAGADGSTDSGSTDSGSTDSGSTDSGSTTTDAETDAATDATGD